MPTPPEAVSLVKAIEEAESGHAQRMKGAEFEFEEPVAVDEKGHAVHVEDPHQLEQHPQYLDEEQASYQPAAVSSTSQQPSQPTPAQQQMPDVPPPAYGQHPAPPAGVEVRSEQKEI